MTNTDLHTADDINDFVELYDGKRKLCCVIQMYVCILQYCTCTKLSNVYIYTC